MVLHNECGIDVRVKKEMQRAAAQQVLTKKQFKSYDRWTVSITASFVYLSFVNLSIHGYLIYPSTAI